MALITSHLLNAVDGTHAAGVEASLIRLADGDVLFSSMTDEGGRLSEELVLAGTDAHQIYALVFKTGSFWAGQDQAPPRPIPEIALHFTMPDADGRYHMPVILSPHGYSTWASG